LYKGDYKNKAIKKYDLAMGISKRKQVEESI